MHILDLGLFKYMLDYTKELLYEQCGSQVIQVFENRLSSISRYPGLKIMKNIFNITCMTADEFRNIMKVIIFALDNLYNKYRKPGISNKRLCQVYYKFLRMYLATREESFDNDSINQLQVKNKYDFLNIKIINNYYYRILSMIGLKNLLIFFHNIHQVVCVFQSFILGAII
jgi:hypothetical protein